MKTRYRVLKCVDGSAEEFCGEFGALAEAQAHADKSPDGLPRWQWESARAAGDGCAPDADGEEADDATSWHGSGWFGVFAVTYPSRYLLTSTKGRRTVTGTEADAIREAIKMEEKLQPAFGVTVSLDDETVAEIRDGKRVDDDDDDDADPFAGYTLPVPTHPEHYGAECTDAQAEVFAQRIGEAAAAQFPGLEWETFAEAGAVSPRQRVRGPDEEKCEEVVRWVEENWLAVISR